MELKKIALNDLHEQLGGKMVAFAGYNMPVQYSSLVEEHHTVRKAVGIFDVSHMGEFMVRGPKALELIQKVCSNDASVLVPGKAQYACLPNAAGGIVDDLLVYKMAEEEYMLVVNASNIDKDWAWISQNNSMGAELENISDQLSLFAVQGPQAIAALQKLTDVPLDEVKFYTFVKGELAGVQDVIISATGYTGSGGFELYVPNAAAEQVWHKIMGAGAEFGIKPIGLGARDTLRMEMGFCLYGNDIDDQTSPIEAGLGWITKFTKDFINSANLLKQKEAGIERKLVGFVMQERGIPRKGYEILNEKGETIGLVTSGTQSPTLNQGIGLGYVKTEYAKADTPIKIAVRNNEIAAVVKKLPLI